MAYKRIKNIVALALTAGLCLSLTGYSEAKQPVAAKVAKPPNIVFVLIDDLSANLIRTMPNTKRLRHDGAYFPNAYVADSLCCTSRSSTLTGRYPHVTGDRTNSGKHGGWKAFQDGSNGKKTFAYAMNRRDGRRYRTALQGKFLNGYKVHAGQHVPPGWTQWNAIGGAGYKEWRFPMAGKRTHNGSELGQPIRFTSLKDDGYATHVLTRRAKRFFDDAKTKHDGRPYFLELAPYGTHSTTHDRAHKSDPLFPPALRDRGKGGGGNCGARNCGALKAGDLPGFNQPTLDNRPVYRNGSKAPHWQSNKRLGKHARAVATKRLRDRARMAQAVDRMVGAVRKHAGDNTYIVVTSDNGFHLGQHRSRRGKGTAYDYDIHVPLIVFKKTKNKSDRLPTGPRKQVVSNIDLAPTFMRIGRTKADPKRNGVSFFDALWHPHSNGPKYAFVEHTRPASKGKAAKADPDLQTEKGGTSKVPSYKAVRTKDALLVRYRFGGRFAWEYYRYHPKRRNGMVEKVNTYTRDKHTPQVKAMKDALDDFVGCSGKKCRTARGSRG